MAPPKHGAAVNCYKFRILSQVAINYDTTGGNIEGIITPKMSLVDAKGGSKMYFKLFFLTMAGSSYG